MMQPSTQQSVRDRGVAVIAAAAVAMAVVGFFTGTGGRAPAEREVAAPAASSALPTPSYEELRRGRRGPNAIYERAFADLGRGDLVGPPAELDARQKARRAYPGAPPVIPHAIDDIAPPSCLACHADGAMVGPLWAPKMNHVFRASCTQCHAPAVERGRRKAGDP